MILLILHNTWLKLLYFILCILLGTLLYQFFSEALENDQINYSSHLDWKIKLKKKLSSNQVYIPLQMC